MKHIFIIMKKELFRVFQDKRLVFSMFILPGLLIFLLYSIMGSAFEKEETPIDNKYTVAILNDSAKNPFITYINDSEYKGTLEKVDATNEEELMLRIKSKDLHCLIIFPADFDANVTANKKTDVKVIYNSAYNQSNSAYYIIDGLLKGFNKNLMGMDDVFEVESVTHYDEKKANAEGFAMMLPFLIITFLFSAVLSVTPESIAGEKERGTIATLLVTPTRRRDIALGKIIGLSILSVLGAISSFIGVIASLPKLLGSGSVDMYSFGDYAWILVILIVLVLLIVAVMAVLSAYAKNIKEATMYAMPLLLISMVVGIMSMISNGASHNIFEYFIPIYNSVICLSGIFSFDINVSSILITIGSNLAITGVFVYILTKMFNSERIMFDK